MLGISVINSLQRTEQAANVSSMLDFGVIVLVELYFYLFFHHRLGLQTYPDPLELMVNTHECVRA